MDVSIVEYMLRSLSLFSPDLVFAAVVIVAITAVRSWGLGQTRSARLVADKTTARMAAIPVVSRVIPVGKAEHPHAGRPLLVGAGLAATIIALILAWSSNYIPISTYLVLALLALGPLVLTWPVRAVRHGRFPYSLAIVVAAVCGLWAASLYAQNTGTQAAQTLVRNLPSRTAVVIYSIQRLALSGPGVTVKQLPAGFLYHYQYGGLRLLIIRSGTYYVLPVGWNAKYDLTYIFNEDEEIRIELLSGVERAGLDVGPAAEFRERREYLVRAGPAEVRFCRTDSEGKTLRPSSTMPRASPAAPGAAFTVRTCGTGRLYDPGLVRSFSSHEPRTSPIQVTVNTGTTWWALRLPGRRLGCGRHGRDGPPGAGGSLGYPRHHLARRDRTGTNAELANGRASRDRERAQER